jgi:hypothetical protein
MDDTTPERWLPVPDYEGLYEVSDMGQVRSLPRRNTAGGILRLQPDGRGYRRAFLSRNGVVKTVKVHRLVAAAFIGPCPEGQEVRHGPGGSSDDRAVNLSYGTAQQNVHDKYRDGTMARGERHGRAKLTEAIVGEIRMRYAAGAKVNALARQYGVGHATIGRVISGAGWSPA